MKRITTIIIIALLSSLFGYAQNNQSRSNSIFPPESFSIIEATFNNNPVIGSFNMAYKKYKKKDKYPWCLKIVIGLDLENLFNNGLPKDSESAIAYKLEDELLTEIHKLATAHYIGHLFNDTFLDVYIYLDEPEKAHKYLQTQIDKNGLIREFDYKIIQDSKWGTVSGFLK